MIVTFSTGRKKKRRGNKGGEKGKRRANKKRVRDGRIFAYYTNTFFFHRSVTHAGVCYGAAAAAGAA